MCRFGLPLLLATAAVSASCAAPQASSYLVYVRDRQGSVLAAVDEQGQKVWETHDDSYGLRLSSTGTEIPREFLDQPFDDETGFYRFQSRSYDPATAEWLAPDPMLISNQEYCTSSPELCNPYAYAGDRPGEWTDPDGREVHVQLGESNVIVHATLAVYGTNAEQVRAEILRIPSDVLQGSGDRLEATVHVYATREEIPSNETPINANLASPCTKDISATHQERSQVDLGEDVLGGEWGPLVLWHEILHLGGALDGYFNKNGQSINLPGEELSYMGNMQAKHLKVTPRLQQELGNPPGEEPNAGLSIAPGCDGLPQMDGDQSVVIDHSSN